MKERDHVWDTLVDVCGADTSEMTKSERGKFNRAVKELKDVGAGPGDIIRRAAIYKSKYPGIQVTPNGLVAHWSACKPPPARQPVHHPPAERAPEVSPEQMRANAKRLNKMVEQVFAGNRGDLDGDEA